MIQNSIEFKQMCFMFKSSDLTNIKYGVHRKNHVSGDNCPNGNEKLLLKISVMHTHDLIDLENSNLNKNQVILNSMNFSLYLCMYMDVGVHVFLNKSLA